MTPRRPLWDRVRRWWTRLVDDLTSLEPSEALPGLAERKARVNWHRATPTERGQ